MSHHYNSFPRGQSLGGHDPNAHLHEAEPPADIPSRDTMDQRRQFRDTIHRESVENRLVHQHTSKVGRNIAYILADRAQHGAAAVLRRRQHSTRPNHTGYSWRKGGATSPAAVCELSPSMENSNSPRHVLQANQAAAENNHDDRMDNDDERSNKAALYPSRIRSQIAFYAEYISCVQYSSSYLKHLGGDDELIQGRLPVSSRAVSTISVAFSPDALTMASTHGDHSVKITCAATGRLLESLVGHPRTPWTVKYHPSNAHVLASGCLGHQVRIWNWKRRQCLQMIRLQFAIISLSFHPSGKLLAIANGTRVNFWGLDDADWVPQQQGRDGSQVKAADQDIDSVQQQQEQRLTSGSLLLNELDQRHMLRCVHFPPDGRTIIIGGVNPINDGPMRRPRPGMSFYLRLWDFDHLKALRIKPYAGIDTPITSSDITVRMGSGIVKERPIWNPRTFLPRALLYNDGGFDVSPDGKTLCACAEYWLPEGIDNAMDLVRQDEVLYGSEFEDLDGCSNEPDTRSLVAAALSRLRSVSSPRAANSFVVPSTPPAHLQVLDYLPCTPPYPAIQSSTMSPPSPPGRRHDGGPRHGREMHMLANPIPDGEDRGFSTPPPPPPPAAPPAHAAFHPPHQLSIVSKSGILPDSKGRYVPHVVIVSLETAPVPDGKDFLAPRGRQYGAISNGYRPRVGQILQACPLDPNKASAVTCVKFSPSTDFCLIGFGVREPLLDTGGNPNLHPVTSLYRIKGGMTQISTTLSADDDVNIARFHPDSGCGFVYGTKQGRLRILSHRPSNYYNC